MKKRRNKLVTLGMAAMMTAALMSGCGKKATPENLLKDMAKNMKDTESVVAKHEDGYGDGRRYNYDRHPDGYGYRHGS